MSSKTKCKSCKHPFNEGVQCQSCKDHLDFDCAQISKHEWGNTAKEKRAAWRCAPCRTPSLAPLSSTNAPTLEDVIKEIRDFKEQFGGLPNLIKDVATIKERLAVDITKKLDALSSKVSAMDTWSPQKNLELKIRSMKDEFALLKSQMAASERITRLNSGEFKGVPTKVQQILGLEQTATNKQRRTNKPGRIFYGMASNIFLHAFLIFRTYLDFFIDIIFGFFFEGMRTKLPPLEKRHGMLALSAVELAEKIRKRELKSEELVQACMERINAVNPIVNAVTDERFEAALEEAKQIDKNIEEGLPDDFFKNKPFLGVPFTAKESHAVAGLLHTLGVTSRRYIKASEDAECVRLLREAGAIPIAVTNVPEINKWQETRNMLFGQTKNPYHTGRTTGGSSGGEAALAAALGSPISLCSDIGGSTRMPAFYCGLFGHNPTAGHTSLKGSVLRSGNEETMASIGFAARHCSDLAPLTKVVAAGQAHKLNLDAPVDLKRVKFYYVETAKDVRVSPICQDLRNAMSKVISHLSTEASSTELSPRPYSHPGLQYMYSLWRHAMTHERENFAALLTNNQGEANGLLELFRKVLGQSEYSLAAIMKLLDDQVLPRVDDEWAENMIKDLKDDLLKKLGTEGVLLFPSAPAPAPYHYSAFLRPFNFAYWGVLNVLRLPATQVPLGLDPAGLPLGIQVVAGPRQDALCLAVAKHLELTFGGFVPPCKLVG